MIYNKGEKMWNVATAMTLARKLSLRFFSFVAGALILWTFPFQAAAQKPASLFLVPSSGTFTVGSTVRISLLLNTAGQNVNAVEANLRFPPDKLQVVSPSAGKSLIGIWVSQPNYDNRKGVLRFQGAIPNPGINTSRGVISDITFRVVGVGTAILQFEDSSKVLLNDGKGTNILGQVTNGVYHFVLPPPAGPVVTSPTHPDQETWYRNSTVTFEWESEEGVDAYSYMLNKVPVDTPDNIPEGRATRQTYTNLADGVYYFHIKALRDGVWGGVTHYAVKIDTTPPAKFPIQIFPSSRTASKKIVADFSTTDALSGVDHYEVAVIPLTPKEDKKEAAAEPFFVEAESPFNADLDLGTYDVAVIAYDKAGNAVQSTQRVYVVEKIFEFVQDRGIRISGFIVPWIGIWIGGGVLLLLLLLLVVILWRHHRGLEERRKSRELPEEIRRQLQELAELRKLYQRRPPHGQGAGAKLGALLLAMALTGMTFFSLVGAPPARAEEGHTLSPPLVTMVSRHISNQELFYIGGVADVRDSMVVVYLQNVQTGATVSAATKVDKEGKWFYSHPSFLTSGRYLLWAQMKVGEEMSPPSPQITLTVSPTAIQIGASRISYETLYLIIAVFLALVLLVLVGVGAMLAVRIRRKRQHLAEELRAVEESLKRGFAMLRRDIEAELELIHDIKMTKKLSDEEQQREQRLLRDLERIKNYLGKEIWEVEQEVE